MSEIPDAKHMDTLKAMGFDEERARQALIGTKNDVEDAVAILTESDPPESSSLVDLGHVDTQTLRGSDDDLCPPSLLTEKDVDTSTESQDTQPPSYEEALGTGEDSPGATNGNGDGSTPADDNGPQEFPLTNLYELEGRVFTESWSIPFRRNESLGKCLQASISLARHGEQRSPGLLMFSV